MPVKEGANGMSPRTSGWRYFTAEQLRDALMWAARGGIAVFDAGTEFLGMATAHLLAESETALIDAAEELGLNSGEIHHRSARPLTHFTLVESSLLRA
jgi:hypothetical protein